MFCGNIAQHFDNLVNITSIGDANRNPNPVPGLRTARFIDDFSVAKDTIRNRDLDIVTSQDPRAPQPDKCDLSPFPGIKNNEIDLIFLDDGQPGEKVRQGVFSCEAECEADDTCCCQPCGDIYMPGEENEVNSERKQHNLKNVV